MLRKLFAPDGAPSGGTATAEPPPASQTPPATGGSSFEFSKQLYDDLAGLDEPDQTTSQTPQPTGDDDDGSPPPEKPPEKPEGKTAEKTAEKPPEKATDKSLPPAPSTKPKAKDLKIVYEEAKARIATLEPELAETKKKLELLEKAGPGSEVATLAKQLEASETRRKELEREIEFKNFEKSAKFEKEYQQPYVNAFKEALEEISEFQVEGQDRAGNQNDLVEICRLPGGEALKRATELFGDHVAGVIMTHRREIRRLAKAQEQALVDAKNNADSRMESEKAEVAKNTIKLQEVWQQAHSKLSKQFPHWVNAVEGDEEGNKLLVDGYKMVDRFFQDPNLTPEQKVEMHAEIRMRVANHDRMGLRNKRLRLQLKDVQNKLAQYEQSTPPGGGSGTGRTSTQAASIFDDLHDQAKKWDAAGT